MLRRGFKAEAERQAERIRTEMGLRPAEPASPLAIAKHLAVEVRKASELVPVGSLRTLERLQPDAFSACTFRLPGGRVVVVYNPLHSSARTKSDLAHELAHLILNHDTSTIERIGEWNFFTCDADQEDEANWLAGCLLLPRALLLTAARRGWAAERIALEYEVSEQMARFRLNASGALLQVGRERGRSRASRS